jgi:hypothetical protein
MLLHYFPAQQVRWLRDRAVAPPSTIKRCTNTVVFQGMTVQAINGASREDLLRLSDTALRIWPE